LALIVGLPAYLHFKTIIKAYIPSHYQGKSIIYLIIN
jgi:hypothetical protein